MFSLLSTLKDAAFGIFKPVFWSYSALPLSDLGLCGSLVTLPYLFILCMELLGTDQKNCLFFSNHRSALCWSVFHLNPLGLHKQILKSYSNSIHSSLAHNPEDSKDQTLPCVIAGPSCLLWPHLLLLVFFFPWPLMTVAQVLAVFTSMLLQFPPSGASFFCAPFPYNISEQESSSPIQTPVGISTHVELGLRSSHLGRCSLPDVAPWVAHLSPCLLTSPSAWKSILGLSLFLGGGREGRAWAILSSPPHTQAPTPSLFLSLQRYWLSPPRTPLTPPPSSQTFPGLPQKCWDALVPTLFGQEYLRETSNMETPAERQTIERLRFPFSS